MKSIHIKAHLITAFSLLLLAVILGAFGAHSLKGVLSTDQISSYQTAVQYQMTQSLGAILLAILSVLMTENILFRRAAMFLLIGVILFSGSIYVLVLPILDFIPKAIVGPITPIGGIFFIWGWGIALYSIIKTKNYA